MFVIDTSPVLVIVPVNPITPPGIPFVPGQILVIAKRGVVRTGQLVVAVATTPRPEQIFVPRAVNVSVIEQTLVGTSSLPLKLLHSPLVRKGILITRLVPVLRTRSLNTVTLVRGTLPVLHTVPLNVSKPPGNPLVGGHSLVTVIAGVVQTRQTALLVAQTVF